MTRHQSPRRSRLAALALAGCSVVACNNNDQVLVPNRVLDRPLDITLACVQRDGAGGVSVLSLNLCRDSISDCTDVGPQLIGFVTNSERNELAMFRRCDRNGLVDLDPEVPGYNFVPVGQLPSAIARSEDSCRVVTANVGSCDLSVVDVPGLAAFALQLGSATPPSALVSTIVPRRSDGEPLGAAPGAIIGVPREFSRAALEDDPSLGGGDTGGGDTGGGETGADTEGDDPLSTGLACDPEAGRSVWVTFPSCQLVAEVSLQTQRILQSRQFVTAADGSVTVEDAGPDPICPVECPAQFDGAVPGGRPTVDPAGVFPVTLEFIEPPQPLDETDMLDEAELLVDYAALFVGGTGADEIFELRLDGRQFVPAADTARLLLENPQGVHAIRATPAAAVLGESHQFLYVVAGDGSTHVVDRDFDEDVLGVECDTQVDPTQVASTACHPIDANSFGNSPERRPFAVGPGIRDPLGGTINDWSFHKAGGGGQIAPSELNSLPLAAPGIVGVGVTSFGRLVYSHFGQYGDLGRGPTLASTVDGASIDPVETMNVGVRPHMLWPALDPFAVDVNALPRVSDDEPGRGIPGDPRDTQRLGPNLRRVDRAYAEPIEAEVSDEQATIAARLGGADPVRNVDQLAGYDEAGLYENAVARIAARDYQLWRAQSWSMEWEGLIPGTTSATGIIQCDQHGGVDDQGLAFAGGTCRSHEAGDIRLVDEGATFCEDGVLAGDTLVVQGCVDDGGCGDGQRCLTDPTASISATGICISEQEYESSLEELRAVCRPFITDPCGAPAREYRVVRSFQSELWLQAVDRRTDAILRDVSVDDEPVRLVEYEAKLSCATPIAHRDVPACQTDEQCQVDPYAAGESRARWTCEIADGDSEGRCVGEQPDGGCDVDSDCRGVGANYVCVEELCRAPCNLCAPPSQPAGGCIEDADCGADQTCFAGTCHVPCEDDSPGCIETPLPGPRCFPEFVRYVARTRDAFTVTEATIGMLNENIRTDPDTTECLVDPTASTLLTGRLRLGADEDATFNHPVWGIPDCPNPLEASPTDPNPCRITTSRSTQADSLFHAFTYQNGTGADPVGVEAIRFSNPFLSATVDLTSLLDLASDVPDFGGAWPPEFAVFRRSRIPRGYRMSFSTEAGYTPFDDGVAVANQTPLTYPVRVIPAPELNIAYVVDAGGRGGLAGVRGQVVRVILGESLPRADENFRVQ
jgi:hypothetical protein